MVYSRSRLLLLIYLISHTLSASQCEQDQLKRRRLSLLNRSRVNPHSTKMARSTSTSTVTQSRINSNVSYDEDRSHNSWEILQTDGEIQKSIEKASVLIKLLKSLGPVPVQSTQDFHTASDDYNEATSMESVSIEGIQLRRHSQSKFKQYAQILVQKSHTPTLTEIHRASKKDIDRQRKRIDDNIAAACEATRQLHASAFFVERNKRSKTGKGF